MQPRRPALEVLEDRAVPAQIALVRGSVLITGDAADNYATAVVRRTTLYIGVKSTTAEGTTIVQQKYALPQVSAIRFSGGDGNDFFFNNTNRPSAAAGGNGNDSFYGGSAADVFDGGAGLDGLYGGTGGRDRLVGGADADRFLVRRGVPVTGDATAQDAVITYRNAARAWTDAEIQATDLGLYILHRHAGNARLLKRANGANMTFLRNVQDPSPDGGTTLAINHENGTLDFFNGAFTSKAQAVQVTIHEMGHNWDDPNEPGGTIHADWLAQSGWRNTPPPAGQADDYQQSADDRTWYHLKTAQFANNYGATNPFEDWSTAWQSYFTARFGLPNTDDVVPLPAGKTQVLDTFFAAHSG